jgi:hypothetical protein
MRPGYLIWALAVLWQPIVGGCLMASPAATTCGELADKYRLNPELTDAAMVLWAEGFMRNMNEELRPEARQDLTIDSKDQADRLRAYCDAHPFASFDQAVKNIYLNFQP